MPRQSGQCCQQVEGKVPSHGEASGAQKNLDKILQPDLPRLPNSSLSSNDKDILQQNILLFVYRNKTGPAQGKQPKEPYSYAGREGTFPSTYTHSTWARGKTFVMERHKTFLTGALTVEDCQFHLSDLKSHKNRIPVICNYPGAQILWMKGSLTQTYFKPRTQLQGVQMGAASFLR